MSKSELMKSFIADVKKKQASPAYKKKKYEEQKEIWVDIGDQRECPDCRPLGGRIETRKYWNDTGRPRSRDTVCKSNCRCQLFPVQGTLTDLLTKRIKLIDQVTSEYMGKVFVDKMSGNTLLLKDFEKVNGLSKLPFKKIKELENLIWKYKTFTWENPLPKEYFKLADVQKQIDWLKNVLPDIGPGTDWSKLHIIDKTELAIKGKLPSEERKLLESKLEELSNSVPLWSELTEEQKITKAMYDLELDHFLVSRSFDELSLKNKKILIKKILSGQIDDPPVRNLIEKKMHELEILDPGSWSSLEFSDKIDIAIKTIHEDKTAILAWNKMTKAERIKLLQSGASKGEIRLLYHLARKKLKKEFPDLWINKFDETERVKLAYEELLKIMGKSKKYKPAKKITKLSMIDQSIQDHIDAMKTYNSTGASILEKKAVRIYTDAFYDPVNSYLRGQGNDLPESGKSIIANIRNYLKKAPKYSGDVYRGFSLTEKGLSEFLAKTKPGNIVTLKGFTSTTTSRAEAKAVALNHMESRDDKIVMGLMTIRSKNGVSVREISVYPGEDEILFLDSTKFRVTSVKDLTKKKKGESEREGLILVNMEEI